MWCPYQSSAPHIESQSTHPTQLLSGSALRTTLTEKSKMFY
jgi:hypothetical protein